MHHYTIISVKLSVANLFCQPSQLFTSLAAVSSNGWMMAASRREFFKNYLGGWHKVALEQFRKLGSALARHTGQDEGEKTGHLVKRASILLQKGLAAMVNRIPGHPPPVIDGQE